MAYFQVVTSPKKKNEDLTYINKSSLDSPFQDVSLTGTDSLFEGNINFADSTSLSPSKPENSFQLNFEEFLVQDENPPDPSEDNEQKSEQRAKWRAKYERVYKKNYKCGICSKFYSKFSSLLQHDKTDHKDMEFEAVCLKCERTFISNQRLELHDAMKHREKIHECEGCNLKFSTAKSLKVHTQKHSGKFQCDVCVYSASSNSELQNHKLIHDAERKFVCPICSERFKQRQGLTEHMKQLHSSNDEPPSKAFKCNVCYKLFETSKILQSHKESHGTSNNFVVCEICGSMFRNNSQLSRHKIRHEPKETRVTYTCEICDKSFSSKSLVTRHTKSTHILKRFDCKVCKASFTRKDTREQHMKTHFVTIPIKCDFCEQKFRLKRYYVRHLARKHPGVCLTV